MEIVDDSPLCCCEYIGIDGERNHILACCCNCYQLDSCCDRLLTCRKVSASDMSAVLISIKDRLRCPSRRGAIPISVKLVAPFLIQPIFAVLSVSMSNHCTFLVVFLVFLQIFLAWYMTKRKARSPILYHWTISAILYCIIIFEVSVTPMMEIRFDENLLLVFVTTLAILCFWLVKKSPIENSSILQNGLVADNTCPICWMKMAPRSYHCTVCQTCVPRFDHHCYWLDCCIGEDNQFQFFFGLLFASLALLYGSMLILTTVCRPVFRHGILVPDDCSDVTDHLEMGLCYVCGIYCLSLVPVLFGELVYHFCLISWGLSGLECSKNGCLTCSENLYSRGFCNNWGLFFRNGWKRARFR